VVNWCASATATSGWVVIVIDVGCVGCSESERQPFGLQVGQVADRGSSARQLSGKFAWARRQLKEQSSVERVHGHGCKCKSEVAVYPGMGVCGQRSKYDQKNTGSTCYSHVMCHVKDERGWRDMRHKTTLPRPWYWLWVRLLLLFLKSVPPTLNFFLEYTKDLCIIVLRRTV
jgi:hypothetical protein